MITEGSNELKAGFFEGYDGIRIVAVTDWLDWCCNPTGSAESHRILLPMIQRGFVWKPHQVMDLWDTLLRDMPIGSMLASSAATAGAYVHPITRKKVADAQRSAVSLLDGQQRTLAMLLGWTSVAREMHRKVWVDLGVDDKTDHLFRYHFTTQNHPFGFPLAGTSGQAVGRLSMADRRVALLAHELMHGDVTGDSEARRKAIWEHARPWHGVLPVDLSTLFELSREGNFKVFQAGIEACRVDMLKHLVNAEGNAETRPCSPATLAALRRRCTDLDARDDATVRAFDARCLRLYDALRSFRGKRMPVIEVPERTFAADSEAVENDPPLAVLFQRIGTGGTSLSNADYVYSVIKHRSNRCHDLVEEALKNSRVGALFTPVSLVTTAVRVTAAMADDLPDYAQISKVEFARLMRKQKDSSSSTQLTFVEQFERNISDDGPFRSALVGVLDGLAFNDRGPGKNEPRSLDIGFPKHALCLIELPVLSAMVFWLTKCRPASHSVGDLVGQNRQRLIRFALYCALTVTDLLKASQVMFEVLKKEARDQVKGSLEFPEMKLVNALVAENLSLPMPSPRHLEADRILSRMIYTHSAAQPRAAQSTPATSAIRGWRRFDLKSLTDPGEAIPDADADRLGRMIRAYSCFWNRRMHWNHKHELLLWLQREYVYQKFEQATALPGSEDETPYDYDHICPQSHWSDWTGSKSADRIIDFLQRDALDGTSDRSAHNRVGNAIGNLRVWDSSDNRSDGDASPRNKLALEPNAETNEACRQSRIAKANEPDWIDASGGESARQWTAQRAHAFQRAVEVRTFDLYSQFFNELGFEEYQTLT